jgi:hypothetical protein
MQAKKLIWDFLEFFRVPVVVSGGRRGGDAAGNWISWRSIIGIWVWV